MTNNSSSSISRKRALHYGLALVLMFIGAKMLLSYYYEIPVEWALGTVAVVLLVSVLASLAHPKPQG